MLDQPEQTLTVFLKRKDGDILARGICEDETLFDNVHYKDIAEAYSYFNGDTIRRAYRIVINIEPSCHRR